MRVTPYEWFKWTSPGSQLSLRGGVLETEMGQFFRKWLVGEGLLPDVQHMAQKILAAKRRIEITMLSE